jgi:enoyl-CoA hydratase/carnithine racemase
MGSDPYDRTMTIGEGALDAAPREGEPLLCFRDGHIAHVVLNRPAKLNAIDGVCLGLLRQAVQDIEADDAVRAVVLSGAGRAFCAGADLDYVGAQMESATEFAQFLAEWHGVFGGLERCSKPTIAAVQGVALAGGLELTQVCDVVVAAEDARFGDQHAKFGLFPGGGSTQRLPRLVGARRARWLLLSGEHFTAADAYEFGMVNAVVPPAELLTEALSMAGTLARLSRSASTAIKRAALEGADLTLVEGLQRERELAVDHMLGVDARIGLAAFRERQSPIFSGLRESVGAPDGER